MTEPAVFSVETLLAQAKRLGLVPSYRLGTVFATANGSSVMVTLDNDTAPSRCYNFSGALEVGDRVLTVAVKPQGVYVLGGVPGAAPNPVTAVINQPGAADSTTSAAYVNMAGSISIAYTKMRADTFLEVDMRVGAFTTGVAPARPSYAVQIAGVDYEVVAQTINPLSTHTMIAGVELISGLAAGDYTIQGRWLRQTGTATLQRNSDDWITLKVRETF